MYIFQKKGLGQPIVEPVGLKRYMLVRIALDAGAERWFGEDLAREAQEREAAQVPSGFLARLRRLFFGKKEPDAPKPSRREAQLCRVESAIQRLAEEARELAGEENACYCVYENSSKNLLAGQAGILAGLWQRHFPWKEFDAYCGRFWVGLLLEEGLAAVPGVGWPHFVILGEAPCVPEVIEAYAGRMKSLRWILPEPACTEEIWDFVEDFYVESGLAISLSTIPSAEDFAGMRLVCGEPSNILDFTEETRMDLSGVAAGSVWMDFRSVEGKRRRIAERSGTEIRYVSLREKWKYAQRRCREPRLS